ncbi:MAG: amino acid ABC transporter ATP-binding protein [Vampirovibrio sp.]|nr:amino acid ABC transporter ATP-binding protein [Vampirovibrio sp.]
MKLLQRGWLEYSSNTALMKDTTDRTTTKPFVEVKKVHKAFGPQPVLRGLDMAVNPGETIVLMGASGCGKTTLLRCLNGLETPESGSILVNRTTLCNTGDTESQYFLQGDALHEFRASVGMVFQQFNLFPHLNVMDNIMLGPVKVLKTSKEEVQETTQKWLDRIGILNKASHFPDQLSGGEKQRVAIVRSLMMNPKLMLFDEPTSALDPQMTREVLDLIKEIAEQGMTLLIVTHHGRFAETIADRILLMDNGVIVEEGPPPQLLNTPQHPATQAFIQGLL